MDKQYKMNKCSFEIIQTDFREEVKESSFEIKFTDI